MPLPAKLTEVTHAHLQQLVADGGLRSDSQAQRLWDFRIDRLAKIVTGQTPVRLGAGPKLVVHAATTQVPVYSIHWCTSAKGAISHVLGAQCPA